MKLFLRIVCSKMHRVNLLRCSINLLFIQWSIKISRKQYCYLDALTSIQMYSTVYSLAAVNKKPKMLSDLSYYTVKPPNNYKYGPEIKICLLVFCGGCKL